MEVICLEDAALYELIETVVQRIQGQQKAVSSNWIGSEEAMQILNIKSKTTLQKLRDEGLIKFSQPQKRIILYDRSSIEAYLEQHVKNIF